MRPDKCHGTYLPDEECQGISLLDAARFFETTSVKTNVVRMQGVIAIGVQTTSVKANVVQMQDVTANGVQTTSASAYAFQTQTRSVKVFAFLALPYLPIAHVSSHAIPDSTRPHAY
jgi:hypothetical protein